MHTPHLFMHAKKLMIQDWLIRIRWVPEPKVADISEVEMRVKPVVASPVVAEVMRPFSGTWSVTVAVVLAGMVKVYVVVPLSSISQRERMVPRMES